ncbi:hypothetical protein [Bacillus cereus]|uniref:S1 motif domain-containing protein n=1 Tax=Bacillus cereus TIAC219 TaxID=718222 RepID=A0ABC9SR25_BACCE|nr:hypothetical protein [Bacillus cereus]EJP85596.1 hypothetical protein IC1_04634 [Bacillus cereus VD022]EOQ58089.1 hypothetical protein IAY_03733 [Bacillus cereus TIAC219]MCU5086839.1 hypothetical protein [Bacillus cereus]TKH78854.1 hypothetical protein FC686_13175 [Bacillus cereus]
MKNKLIAAGIVTGTLLSFPSGIFADSISKVTNPSQNTIESMKQGENFIVGVITDADDYYATVEYKDSEGKKQIVDIDFPNADNSNFKTGDTVKVANKDKWEHKKIGMHDVAIASADSISKVKQSVAQTDKPQNNTTQPFIEKNNKRTGKVIEKGSNYLMVKQGDVTIKTNVRKKVLENINIGDTVHVYAESFTGSNLPIKDQTLHAQRSIVQKVGEPIDSNYIKFTGKVVSKNGNNLVVSNGKMNMSARTSSKVIQEINIGDTVNIYTTTVVGGMIGSSSAGSAVIEK